MYRTTLVTLAAVSIVAAVGCRKPPSTNAIPGVGPPPPPPASVKTDDYRTLDKSQIERLIRDSTNSPVSLTAAGADRYTGTRQSPDGTAQMQVVVTVESERIVIETKGGGMSAREIVTPQGLKVDDVR
jgi:hypothetical protein